MGTITVSDGTEIYFKDWGKGPVVTFSHGWPLSADQWDPQMLFLSQHGFRTIAHDRRGHGRSSQPSQGNNLDTYGDDLAELIEALDLRDITVVGHSTGCGEVAKYIGRHGTARVKKVALISGVPPHLAPTADDPSVCRRKRSTASSAACSRTLPPSTRASRASSTARTVTARTCRRACSTSSGARRCSRG
jgi:non-heme chloroperoxidase